MQENSTALNRHQTDWIRDRIHPVANTKLLTRHQPMSVEEIDLAIDNYAEHLANGTTNQGINFAATPSSPFGPSLERLGVFFPTTIVATDNLQTDQGSKVNQGSSLPAGFILGQNLSNSMLKAFQKQARLPGQPGQNEEPKFPGKHGDFGDHVEWAIFYTNLNAKFPGLDGTFDEYKNYVRDFLIQRGISYATNLIKDLATNLLVELLDDASSTAIKQAIGETAGEGIFGGFLSDLEQQYEKYKDILTNPDKLFDFAIENGLPKLADVGLNSLFGMWKIDDSCPLSEHLAKMAVEKLVHELVDQLLDGVKNLNDLVTNFSNLQANLEKKIDEFFNGTPGKATLPAVRMTDKDDKVDVVATGLASVIVEGHQIARVLDTLAPSKKVIVEGSTSVLSGTLPTARLTSKTSVPSMIVTGAVKVFIGDPAVIVQPPTADAKKPSNNGDNAGQTGSSKNSPSNAKQPSENKKNAESSPQGNSVNTSASKSNNDQTGEEGCHSPEMEQRRAEIRKELANPDITPDEYDRLTREYSEIDRYSPSSTEFCKEPTPPANDTNSEKDLPNITNSNNNSGNLDSSPKVNEYDGYFGSKVRKEEYPDGRIVTTETTAEGVKTVSTETPYSQGKGNIGIGTVEYDAKRTTTERFDAQGFPIGRTEEISTGGSSSNRLGDKIGAHTYGSTGVEGPSANVEVGARAEIETNIGGNKVTITGTASKGKDARPSYGYNGSEAWIEINLPWLGNVAGVNVGRNGEGGVKVGGSLGPISGEVGVSPSEE